MPVTELALLRLQNGASLQSDELKSDLLKAKKLMEDFTSKEFYFLRQVEDPSFLYLVGNWDSPRQHFEQWIPTDSNQELLRLLKDRVSVEWMFHVDVDPRSLPISGAPIIAVGRLMVNSEKKEAFAAHFRRVRHHLEDYIAPHTLAGGWRVEKVTESEEEWVMFTGWESVEQHTTRFVQTDAFKEYAVIADYTHDREFKHAVKLDLAV